MTAWWRDFENRPRRPAANGIRAKSQSGQIGESWWSERFITAIEALTDAARLGRGRSYARTGQVMDLEVTPGLVTARVQGSRRTPYQVRIAVRPLTEPQWRRVEQAMAEQAIFLAALLAGEMPRDIEDAFAAAELSLFPARHGDLHSECSCPDWANPCKHIAATVYLLGEAFDEDPFLMLTLRGREKNTLLARLRERRAAAGAADDAGDGDDARAAGDAETADDALRGEAGGVGAAPETGRRNANERGRTPKRIRRTRATSSAPAGASAAGAPPGEAASPGDAPSPGTHGDDDAAHAAPDDTPLEAMLCDFWNAGPEPEQRPALPRAAQLPDALLRELGPIPPEAGGPGANERLAAAYAAITAAAARRALGGGG